MDQTMRRVQKGALTYYVCTRLPVRHAFTTKFGGVSAGPCESLNLGFGRGDTEENVRKNYALLADALGVPAARFTLTKQIHEDEVSVVSEQESGMGLQKPMTWQSDAIITALGDTPLVGFGADCVVTLLCDPAARVCGVCHAGWRGTAKGILGKTVAQMTEKLGAHPETMVAVMGPSIHQECFETDSDVPDEMERLLGAMVRPFVMEKGEKFHVDLQGVNAALLARAGLRPENIVDSGLCTMCEHQTFWSHRHTNGVRGVQAGVICL